MGRQVPDISPEGLAQLTASYRESVDREAVRSFFEDKTVDESVLIRWRESSGISANGAARLLGMSSYGYKRIESGGYPIGEHFVGAMRKLLTQLDETGFPFHPSDRSKSGPRFRTHTADYLPRDRIKTATFEMKCANPNCSDPWFISANANRRFCSQKCSDYVGVHEKIDGVLTRKRRDYKEFHPVTIKCPNCGHDFPAKGHITSGSNNNIQRNRKGKANGQANHDGEREEPTEVR